MMVIYAKPKINLYKKSTYMKKVTYYRRKARYCSINRLLREFMAWGKSLRKPCNYMFCIGVV